MKITAVIDKIENETQAMLEIEGKGLIAWPAELLPENCSAGCVVSIKIERDLEKEKSLKENILKLQEKLLKKKR